MPLRQLGIYGGRLGVVAVYVLLLFSLQPLLLDHAFAAGSSDEHSDQDVCAWLDHAASAGLHSVTAPVGLLHLVAAFSPYVHLAFHSIGRSCNYVRGPPSLI
jgi:hypothetical protein